MPAEGTVAVGDRSTVETVIDVVAGDASSVGGRVRVGFEASADDAIRVAAAAPDGFGSAAVDDRFDPATLRSITHAYGASQIDGDESRTTLTIQTDDASAAPTLRADVAKERDMIATAVSVAQVARPVFLDLEDALRSLDIRVDGDAVVLETDDPTLLPSLAGAVYAGYLASRESERSPPDPSSVSFAFDYDPDTRLLTITHAAGDTVSANATSIRGEQVETGTWRDLGGDSGGANQGDLDVVAGQQLTVDADPDYLVDLVWEAPDGSKTTVLASDRGPEA